MRVPIGIWAAVLLFAPAACRSRPDIQAVVLVTLDTTRADHLGCYGNPGVHTPVLDRLAREGVVFAQASAAAPITLPSHATMMTGRYPAAHGARNNGMFVVPGSERTLAEIFKARGFETGAFVGGFPLAATFGLAQGFDTYDDRFENALEAPGVANEDVAQRRADQVNAAALPWLEARRGRRFFLWVHYYDPHAQYDPPSPFRERYAHNLYDGEIAFTDSQLGRLLEGVAQAADPERTVIGVVGDHGESLGQHGEASHGVLIYEASIQIPFVLKAPGLPAGALVREPVSNADVFPTLLSLAGLAGETRGAAQGHGVDLSALAAARAPAPARPAPIVVESLLGNLEMGWSPLHAIRSGPWKYVEAPRPELYELEADPREETNLLAAGVDAPADAPAQAERLRSELERFLSLAGAPASEARAEVDEETSRRLESLGYLQGGAADAAPPEAGRAVGPLKDPKDHIGLYQQIIDIGDLFRRGRHEEVITDARRVLAVEPGIPRLELWLAESLVATGRAEEAEALARPLMSRPGRSYDWVAGFLARERERAGDPRGALALYRAALARGQDRARNLLMIARLLHTLGDDAGCLAEARRILQDDPRSVPALQLAADSERRLGNPAGAVELWKRSLEASPDDPVALATTGTLLFSLRRFDESRPCFQRLSEVAPDNPAGPRFLGGLAVIEGRHAEALPLLRRAAAMDPADPRTRYWMGMALMKTGDLSAAEEQFTALMRSQPNSSDAARGMGLLRKEQGRPAEAGSLFEQALRLNPADEVARRALSEVQGGS